MRSAIILSATLFFVISAPALAEQSNAEYFIGEAARAPAASLQKKRMQASLRRNVRVARVRPARGGSSSMASWYGGGEKLARHTASGEIFRPNGFTAAHRTLPLGTRLAVSANGRTVMVRVNDRGPAAWTGRSLDLSRGAARALGMIGKGTARVSWRTA